MSFKKVLSVCGLFAVAGCGIPPVDPTFISDTPASAQSFAVAARAVRACTPVFSEDTVERNFRAAGFSVGETRSQTQGSRTNKWGAIIAPDPAVKVHYTLYRTLTQQNATCYVGLENMTPEQSKQLAQIWVKAHGAKSNAEHGDGLSDHVSGAWRRFYSDPEDGPAEGAYWNRMYIAAYKTWPHGPYAVPRSPVSGAQNVFPDKPGAAVRLNLVSACKADLYLNKDKNGLLPCSTLGKRLDQGW